MLLFQRIHSNTPYSPSFNDQNLLKPGNHFLLILLINGNCHTKIEFTPLHSQQVAKHIYVSLEMQYA